MYKKEKIFETFKDIIKESESIKPYVIICQPRRNLNEIPAQNFNGSIGIHIDMCGYSHAFTNIGGETVDVARNYLIEQAIASDAKYMLFIGEDTILPIDAFNKLHKTAEQNPDAMIVGVYYLKASSPMIYIKKNDYIIPADVSPGQLIDTWLSGLDCALIPVKILKDLKAKEPDNVFCCIASPNSVSEIPNLPFIGEDNYFIHRLRKEGYKILCDTDVQCLHIDLESGKYAAHSSVDLRNYFTNIPITEEFTTLDKKYIEERANRELKS